MMVLLVRLMVGNEKGRAEALKNVRPADIQEREGGKKQANSLN
jgi:hypothetical protein